MLLVLLTVGIIVGTSLHFNRSTDYAKVIATMLNKELKPGQNVYTGNYHQIVSHLLHKDPVSPYVHSSLLYFDHHIFALQINVENESKYIVDEVRPRFILQRMNTKPNVLSSHIQKSYSLIDTLPDNVLLYERP